MSKLSHDHTATAAALHEVATFIGRLPADVPPPTVAADQLSWNVYADLYSDEGFHLVRTVAQEVRHIARALGGRWAKNDPASGSSFDEGYYILDSAVEVGGRKLRILCPRRDVCEPVQVGVEVVKVEARPAVVAHEEERPVWRYDCKPLNDAAGRELADILDEVTA